MHQDGQVPQMAPRVRQGSKQEGHLAVCVSICLRCSVLDWSTAPPRVEREVFLVAMSQLERRSTSDLRMDSALKQAQVSVRSWLARRRNEGLTL